MRLLAPAALATLALAVNAKAPLTSNGDVIDDAYIVRFKDSASPADVAQHMENLKEWNANWPLRGEAGNLGVRVDDKDKDEGSQGSDGGQNTGDQGGKDESVQDGGQDGSTQENNKDESTPESNKDESSTEENRDDHKDSSDTTAGSFDWDRIPGITHTWYYESLNYFGYSGRFSQEVLKRIRQDGNIAYVEQDQVVGINPPKADQADQAGQGASTNPPKGEDDGEPRFGIGTIYRSTSSSAAPEDEQTFGIGSVYRPTGSASATEEPTFGIGTVYRGHQKPARPHA